MKHGQSLLQQKPVFFFFFSEIALTNIPNQYEFGVNKFIAVVSALAAGNITSKAYRILLVVTGRSGGMFCKNQKFTQSNQQSSHSKLCPGHDIILPFCPWHLYTAVTFQQDHSGPVIALVDAVATVMRCSLGVNVQEKNRARLVLKALCFFLPGLHLAV